jgi:hypothetical protein
MKFYDWRKVQTMLNGVPVSGWAPGDDVYKAERLKGIGESEVGADGLMTLSLNPDKSGKVTIKLAQTSPLNAYLSDISASEDNIDTFIPVTVSQLDTYRLDGTKTTLGYIEKHADVSRGAKAGVVEWSFIFSEIHFELGDPAFSGSPTAVAEALG